MASSRRNNNGILWEVARPLVSWPLRSWPRLLGLVLAFIVVVWVLGRTGSDGKPAAAPSTSSTPTSTASASTSAGQPSAAIEPPTKSATEFVSAWGATQGKNANTWYAAVKPYVDPTLASGLALTDPSNIDPQKVTGAAQVKSNVAGNAIVFVPTSAGGVTVTMIQAGGSAWLADAIDPAKTPSAPSTTAPAKPAPSSAKPSAKPKASATKK